MPKSWQWCQIGNFTDDLQYGTSEKSVANGEVAVLRMGNITRTGEIDYANLAYTSSEADIEKYSLRKGDLLFNRTNSSDWVGKTAFYDEKVRAIYAGYLIRIRPIHIDSEYLNIFMNSDYYRRWCQSVKTDAVNQSNINAHKLSHLWCPIPPLEEQKRITERVKDYIAKIVLIEKSSLDTLNSIGHTKSKILELAMQGKLVPQDPADEPAADMLRRVNPNARIITDNPHSRNIPVVWCITDLKSVGNWQSGATPSKLNPDYYGKGYPWLNTGDLNDNEITSIPKEITELALRETSVKLNPKGSILIAMYGATIGKLGILTLPATTNQACCACSVCHIFNKFLFYFLKSQRQNFITLGGGGAQPNISKEKIEHTIIFLPPLNEQKRIVARIEELYAVIDEIGASLQS